MSNITQTAVILAAGLGSRMINNQDVPKPLIPLNGIPMLTRTINTLVSAGINQIVVVTGYRSEDIEKTLKELKIDNLNIKTVFNPEYKKANGVSVLSASSMVKTNFILTMSDHLLDKEIVITAINTPPKNGVVLCIDKKLNTIFDMDDATKVVTLDNKIIEIGKELTEFNSVDTGVFHASPSLFETLEKEYNKNQDCSLSDGILSLAKQGNAFTADIKDKLWQDVDTPEMFKEAENMISNQNFS